MLLLCTLMMSGTVFVDQHRNDDHRPFDHQLPEVGDPHQGHAVIEGGDFTHSGATLALILGEILTQEMLTGVKHPMLATFRPERFS